MKAKKFLKKYLICLLILILTVSLFNYIVDPMQFYRKMTISKPALLAEDRYQVAALARTQDYDSVIVGTSMTQNFSPKYIKDKLGYNALKLSIAGASINEQILALENALKTNKVKNVIWGLDDSRIDIESDFVKDNFPMYLYDDNSYNDLKYLFSYNTTKYSINTLLNRLSKKVTLENYNNWNKNYKFDEKIIISAFKASEESYEQKQPNTEKFQYKNMIENLNSIENIVKNNKDINFIFFYPPYSILQRVLEYKYSNDVFEGRLNSRAVYFQTLNNYKNIKIFDLRSNADIVENLNNYKDLFHYSQNINNLIIDCIKDNKFLVDSSNYQKYNEALENEVKNYQLNETE